MTRKVLCWFNATLCGSFNSNKPAYSFTHRHNCCVFGTTETHQRKGSGLEPWPRRLTSAPPRLGEIGISADEFRKDTVRLAPIFQPCSHKKLFVLFGLNLWRLYCTGGMALQSNGVLETDEICNTEEFDKKCHGHELKPRWLRCSP